MSLSESVGDEAPPHQPRVGRVGMLALIEAGEVPGSLEQAELDAEKGGAASWRRCRLGWATAPIEPTDGRVRSPELHAVEEELMVGQPPAGLEDGDGAPGQPARIRGVEAGLAPAEPAEACLHGQHTPAAGACCLLGMVVLEDRAR